MKALVYGGPGKMEWRDAPLPEVQDPEDAIVRVDAVTICGTDLHILKGDVPEVEPGRMLGHEAVGTILEVGDGVRSHAVGSRVLISCISGCGRCGFCRAGQLRPVPRPAAAGCSATSSTAPRPSSSGSPSPTPRSHTLPDAVRTRTH